MKKLILFGALLLAGPAWGQPEDCISSNPQAVEALRQSALHDAWKNEWAIGFYADCSASPVAKGGPLRARVEGSGFILILHTHAIFPNSGPSSGDRAAFKSDGIPRLVLTRRGKIKR